MQPAKRRDSNDRVTETADDLALKRQRHLEKNSGGDFQQHSDRQVVDTRACLVKICPSNLFGRHGP